MRPVKGRFIVLDGPDCCGKGTLQQMLVNYLLNHPRDKGKFITAVGTREPSNTVHSAEIRRLLEEGFDIGKNGRLMTELYVSDRKEHVHSVILPNVAAGNIVVCDRYKYSTLAYQSAQGIPLGELLSMHEGLPIPDLVFFIHVPLEERLRRKAKDRNRKFDEVFERHHDFQGQLDENYARLKQVLSDEKIIIINGDRSPEEVFGEIKKHVDELLFGAD